MPARQAQINRHGARFSGRPGQAPSPRSDRSISGKESARRCRRADDEHGIPLASGRSKKSAAARCTAGYVAFAHISLRRTSMPDGTSSSSSSLPCPAGTRPCAIRSRTVTRFAAPLEALRRGNFENDALDKGPRAIHPNADPAPPDTTSASAISTASSISDAGRIMRSGLKPDSYSRQLAARRAEKIEDADPLTELRLLRPSQGKLPWDRWREPIRHSGACWV